tara:strand:- start:42 stop:290 length:249 start_codon:yes stop_codon:yes gene_type:complete
MEITPQILKKPNKYVQPVEKSTQISKIPNKRARDAHDESPQISKKPNKRARKSTQISKKPNKHVMDDYARVNVYDHNPNGNK